MHSIINFLIGLGIGFLIGMACERASLHINDAKGTIAYSGDEYVKKSVVEQQTLENYLTAAGEKH